ncbi:MAG: hypothetical protein K2X72_24230 [Reyranella sp.]|nr:hypothetical protein [Reyranella sp.]
MENRRYVKVAIGVGVGLVLVQAIAAVLVFVSFPDWQTRGQFGDIFGVVNALFSGLAFAGLVYAILLQREDLQLQREELRLTRDELERTADAQEQAEAALRAQVEVASQSARLSATNFLLEHYSAELDGMRGNAYAMGDPRHARWQQLNRRKQTLLSILDAS